jgi:hypothetical protein
VLACSALPIRLTAANQDAGQSIANHNQFALTMLNCKPVNGCLASRVRLS